MHVPRFVSRLFGRAVEATPSATPVERPTTHSEAINTDPLPTRDSDALANLFATGAITSVLDQVKDEAGFSGTVDRVSEVIRKLQASGLDVNMIYHSDPVQFKDYKGPVVVLIPEAHDYIDDADLKHKELKYETSKALCENDKLKITRFAKEGFQGISETTFREVESKSIPELMPQKYFNVPFLIAHTFRGKDLNFVPTEDYSSIFEGFILQYLKDLFFE